MQISTKFISLISALLLTGTFCFSQGITQPLEDHFINPVLPGFHPDPSIIRVGDDYYMATSSFEFWPGIPVYHSKDLVNWKLINHVVTRKEQIDMSGIETSSGFYAPTLREHEGTFYVAVSYVTREPYHVKNMVFTTKDIEKDWSKPKIITDGTEWKIDPDLFFDDDGKVYFSANAQQPDYPDVGWRREIRIQELNTSTWKLTGERHTITKGAMQDAVAVEAPHIYKKDNYYYLLVAEGGTGMGHAVSIFRSKEIFGPYENYSFNPILSHRHMANTAYIQNLGHADIVQTQNGEWWMVLLGVRNIRDVGFPLGRETFLVPIIWEEDEYPVVNPGKGSVLSKDRRPNLPPHEFLPTPPVEDFDGEELPLHWNIIRNTTQPYTLSNGQLKLPLSPATLENKITPAFTGRRIQHHNFDLMTKMKFSPAKKQEEAGLILMLDEKQVYHLLLGQKDRDNILRLSKGEEKEILASSTIPDQPDWIWLRITSRNHQYQFSWSIDGQAWQTLAKEVSGEHLHTPWWVFTGTYAGLYATSNGKPTNNEALFKWFSYRGIK